MVGKISLVGARYAWFASEMLPGDVVVTAHHLDDQVETVLFRLFRGSGVKGLSGIPSVSQFGVGKLYRPFSDLWRTEIMLFAKEQKLNWTEDASNFDLSLDRNFLRQQAIPILESRWPGSPRSIVRASRHMASAQIILDEVGCEDLKQEMVLPNNCLLANHGKISISNLMRLSAERGANLLRIWCRSNDRDAPETKKLFELLRQLRVAREPNNIRLEWKSGEFRGYKKFLYLLPRQIDPVTPAYRIWQPLRPLDLPEVGLRVRPIQAFGAGIRCPRKKIPDLEIRWDVRKGVRPALGASTRSLRNLFQENEIPPWERRRIPIVCIRGTPACLPGIATSVEFAASPNEMGIDFNLEELG